MCLYKTVCGDPAQVTPRHIEVRRRLISVEIHPKTHPFEKHQLKSLFSRIHGELSYPFKNLYRLRRGPVDRDEVSPDTSWRRLPYSRVYAEPTPPPLSPAASSPTARISRCG